MADQLSVKTRSPRLTYLHELLFFSHEQLLLILSEKVELIKWYNLEAAPPPPKKKNTPECCSSTQSSVSSTLSLASATLIYSDDNSNLRKQSRMPIKSVF